MARVWMMGVLLTAVLGGGGLFLLERRTLPAATVLAQEGSVAEILTETEGLHVADRQVRVPILIYHTVRPFRPGDGPDARAYNVAPETFEEQLRHLKEGGYETVSFRKLEDAILRGGALPERPVILTFDDGTSSHYANAFPLLVEYGFTGTFFVFSNAIDRPNYLTSDAMREMRDAGMSFGNHTRYHQYLTRLPADEAVEEMRAAKARLEEVTGEEIDVIAYPFGLYDDAIVDAAALLGHRIGRTIHEGRLHGAEDLMTLGAYQMNDSLRRLVYALGE